MAILEPSSFVDILRYIKPTYSDFGIVAFAITAHATYFQLIRDVDVPYVAVLLLFIHSVLGLFCYWYTGKVFTDTLNLLASRLGLFYAALFSSTVIYPPRELSFNSSTALLDIYNANSPCFRGNVYGPADKPDEWNVNSTHDKMLHRSRRRLWDKTFSTKALNEYYSRVVDQAQKLVDRIGERRSAPLSVEDILNCFVIDVIGGVGFGQELETLKTGSSPILPVKAFAPFFVYSWKYRGWSGYYANFFYVVVCLIIMGWHEVSHKPDICQYITLKESDGVVVSDGVVLSDVISLTVAGGHTSSMAITNTLYNLVKHPKYIRLLRTKIEELFQRTGKSLNDQLKNITHTQLASMIPLLEAVINESLRLYPILPAGLERVTPEDGMTIDGQYIPDNIAVSVPSWTYCRNPLLFPCPNEFIPERWLENDDGVSEHIKVSKDVPFYPFSTGRDSCAGRMLALMELRLVLMILHRFDLRATSQEQMDTYEGQLRDANMLVLPEWEVIFTEREN
ncbi:hypothetical protein FQN57_001091 [Myotisia sp. PD_48]|nr:hypothetical protein FQN57_001091 [Myotisia sp. PD_48]